MKSILTVDERQLNHSWDSLQKGQTSPAPVVVGVHSTPSDQGDNYNSIVSIVTGSKARILTQSSQIPQAVVYGSYSRSMLGMADLSQ